MSVLTMDEETWFYTYKPIANSVPGGTLGECGMRIDEVGYMYETYGADLVHVKERSHVDPRCIWTQTEEDGVCIIQNGYHHVNRLGYFITEEPFIASTTVSYLDIPLWDDNNPEDPNFCEKCED